MHSPLHKGKALSLEYKNRGNDYETIYQQQRKYRSRGR